MEKGALVILTGSLENVVWESNKSPVVAMYGQYFEHQFSEIEAMIPYTNQAGIVMGIMAGRVPIRECHGVRMSEGGLKTSREIWAAVAYVKLTPLAESSKNGTKAYPTKQFLYDHRDQGGRRKFLGKRFGKN